MCTGVQMRVKAKDSRSPGPGVTSSCEPHDVSSGTKLRSSVRAIHTFNY